MSVNAVGVDHSDLMVGQASKRNHRAVRAGRLTVIEGTIDDVPGHLTPFDKAFSINIIQFVDMHTFIARVRAMLKPGGLLATTYQPRVKNATRDDAVRMGDRLRAVLANEGFGDVRIEEIDMNPVPAVCVLARRAA